MYTGTRYPNRRARLLLRAVDVLDGLELRGHRLTAAIDASAAAAPAGRKRSRWGAKTEIAAAAPSIVYTLALHNIADDALLASDADRVRADVASECAEMGDVVGAPRLPLPGDAAGLTVGSAYVDFREKADAERVAMASVDAAARLRIVIVRDFTVAAQIGRMFEATAFGRSRKRKLPGHDRNARRLAGKPCVEGVLRRLVRAAHRAELVPLGAAEGMLRRVARHGR